MNIGDFNAMASRIWPWPTTVPTTSRWLGNGDGTFRGPLNFGAGAGSASVAVGEFNGDGKLDLAVATSINTVSVLPGNGDGTFQAAPTVGVGTNPISVAMGDFNGDRVQDLAVANFNSNNVSCCWATSMVRSERH